MTKRVCAGCGGEVLGRRRFAAMFRGQKLPHLPGVYATIEEAQE